jgi:hypothetical protein
MKSLIIFDLDGEVATPLARLLGTVDVASSPAAPGHNSKNRCPRFCRVTNDCVLETGIATAKWWAKDDSVSIRARRLRAIPRQ